MNLCLHIVCAVRSRPVSLEAREKHHQVPWSWTTESRKPSRGCWELKVFVRAADAVNWSSLHLPHRFSFNSGWKGTAYKKSVFWDPGSVLQPLLSCVREGRVSLGRHTSCPLLSLSLSGNTAGERQGLAGCRFPALHSPLENSSSSLRCRRFTSCHHRPPCSTQVASEKEAGGRGRLGPSRKASVVIITLLQRK